MCIPVAANCMSHMPMSIDEILLRLSDTVRADWYVSYKERCQLRPLKGNLQDVVVAKRNLKSSVWNEIIW